MTTIKNYNKLQRKTFKIIQHKKIDIFTDDDILNATNENINI